MMRQETQFFGVDSISLRAFPQSPGGPFACLDVGDLDDEERYKYFLTCGQVVELAAQATAAVAAFRAAGVLPLEGERDDGKTR